MLNLSFDESKATEAAAFLLSRNVGEWQDPHGTSVPISYSEVLRAGGRSEDFIAAVEGELSAVDKKNRKRPDLRYFWNAWTR